MRGMPTRSGKLGAYLQSVYDSAIDRCSKSALAEEVGTKRNHISHIFSGEMLPRDHMLQRIADAMNITLEPLLALRDEDERIELANGMRKKPVDAKQRGMVRT